MSRYVVISGHRWCCAHILASAAQEAALAIAGICIEERCVSLDAANARAVAIANERGWA